MNSKGVLAVLLVAGIAAGGCDGEEEATRFPEYREYRHQLFESQEACAAAQPPDFFINCYQSVEFFPSGEVRLMVTDIINTGTYDIVGGAIRLDFASSSEVGRTWEFTRELDFVIVDETGNEWQIENSGSEYCEATYGADICE